MADTKQSPIEVEQPDSLPDVPPSGHLGLYPWEGAWWAVMPDGTRRDLTGFTSLQAPVPVKITTSYTVISNTQVFVKKLTLEAGAMLMIEPGAYLFTL